MAESTGIGWCDATFNPWVGCEKVSPGCARCYAETLVQGRMGRGGTWGADGTREVTSPGNWRKPLAWATNARLGLLPDGRPNVDGHRPRVFCASLADVFEPRPEVEEARHALFHLITDTPELDWLLLTKRPEFARDWLAERYARICSECGGDGWVLVVGHEAACHDGNGCVCSGVPEQEACGCGGRGVWGELPPSLWLGVSIENARHTYRADVLREVPAAVRFISAEPLLGSLFAPAPVAERVGAGLQSQTDGGSTPPGRSPLDLTGIDWVIVGGESGGRDARPMHPEWAREIRDACVSPSRAMLERMSTGAASVAAGTGFYEAGELVHPASMMGPRPAFFFKQWGSWRPQYTAAVVPSGHAFHLPDGQAMIYVGASPKSAGNLLDGREWQEFPRSAA